ncbi:MAG TPA: ATP-grasp domain-containing protein [Candidatus Binataceae bacterium]|nr:ATP-grasp domain-containing protein [Candidatus Binataceae bacterium]
MVATQIPSRALILDPGGMLALSICRRLAAYGCEVEIFARPDTPAFFSRFPVSRRAAPPLGQPLAAPLQTLAFEHKRFDQVYVCSEDVLETLLKLELTEHWRGLLLPEPAILEIVLSKNRTTDYLRRAGINVPRTIVPRSDQELRYAAEEIGFPLLIKGERGESARNVRIVTEPSSLQTSYQEVKQAELEYGGKPAVQQFIRGIAYSVGGLFDHGQALRLCAHRKLLTYPANGGVTVRGITQRPQGLVEVAIKVFSALNYSGLGHVEFIKSYDDEQFWFIEVNPRIWGSFELSIHAGVDLLSAYRGLVSGAKIEPNLSYRENVYYHRIAKEVRLIRAHPTRVFGFIRDTLDPRVKSEFTWSDGSTFVRAGWRRLMRRRLEQASLWAWLQRPVSAPGHTSTTEHKSLGDGL